MPSSVVRPTFAVRASCACVAFVLRQPWLVLAVAASLVAASAAFSLQHLRYKTQRNDLISAEKECQKRWQRCLDAFGEDDDFVFAVRGENRDRVIAAVEALAAKLKLRPDHFDRVYHKVDLRGLHSRSLQYLSLTELKDIESRLGDLSPLFGPLSPVGWHALSLETLLSRAKSQTTSADRRLQAELPGILRAATRSLENPDEQSPVWSHRMAMDSPLAQPHYFFTPDGRLATVLARPHNTGDSFTPAKAACDAARSIIDESRREFPDLEFGLTGIPVLETDEMAASNDDSTTASWLALAGVIALYTVVYRGARYPLLTMTTLLVGTAIALGWATLTVGHLNILSATFAVMLIGLGDYGVIWVAHYDEQRRFGAKMSDALHHTAEHAGPGILTAAFTAALAFGATILADFQAVAELGWIAGWGVLFCAASCFVVLPALIAVSDRRTDGSASASSTATFLPILEQHPRSVLMFAILLLLGMLSGISQIRYDANLLNMQARGLDSVEWEKQLIGHSAGLTWDSLSLANTREEALRLKSRYEATPGVGRVVEAASLIPADYESKHGTIVAIHRKLDSLPPTAPEFSLVTAATAKRLSDGLDLEENRLFQNALAALPVETATARLRAFDVRLRRELHADLLRLREVSQPGRITIEDLPVSFRERFIAANGTYLVRAFADESLWDFAALERFTSAAQNADANATGKAFRTLEGLKQMRSGFLHAGLAALAVIVVVLWLDFRSVRYVLLGLLPLALGLVATLGFLGGLGVPLNPANLIALPLIVGVGVDNGVHVLHDYRECNGHKWQLKAATGRGIAVASLTTILGFGTLMIARHRGMASLGFTLTIGVTACMAASLVVLPAILKVEIPKLRPRLRSREYNHDSHSF